MKPINIYALTRINDPDLTQRLERQMSGRSKMLKVKEWETKGIRRFSDMLAEKMEHAEGLCFYYSFIMPKLGKEFDLLRISEKSVVNIELKSGNITDDAIRKQLIKNRYYLAMLGKEIYSYTYVSDENRLVKLSNSNRISDADWGMLIQNLLQQGECYEGDIEDLFQEEQYLISPLSDPEHFLRREYFLTSQQNDIKRHILSEIQKNAESIQGFTGLPGTGKSILLYDIALDLSRRKKVCILHMGPWQDGFTTLHERLKRVDFCCVDENEEILFADEYGAVLVDEGHRITEKNLSGILGYTAERHIPVIIACDREDSLSVIERPVNGIQQIESIPGYIKYQLTNRIRLNSELSSFVYQVMQNGKGNHRSHFPSVQLFYANTEREAAILLQILDTKGYQYIRNDKLSHDLSIGSRKFTAKEASGMEFDRVAMLLDDTFWYDESGCLRSRTVPDTKDSAVRNLYHGLNRAKKAISLVILKNNEVFHRLMYMIQREQK